MSHWRHCKLINKYDTWRVHRVHVLAQLPLESMPCTATSVSLKVCSRVSINLKLWSSWHYRDNCASTRSPHAFGHHRPSVTLRVGPGVVPTEVSINVVVVVVVVVYHKHKSQFYEANTWTATRRSEWNNQCWTNPRTTMENVRLSTSAPRTMDVVRWWTVAGNTE